jgi:hypothetical protein
VISEVPQAVQAGSPLAVKVSIVHLPAGEVPSGSGTLQPAAGVTVSFGEAQAVTSADGVATLTPVGSGPYTLRASAPGDAPSRTYSVCVHAGNDGTCGTTAPQGSLPSSTSTTTSQSTTLSGGAPYRGPFALVARTNGPVDGHVYSRRGAPRILAGSVLSHSPVTSVALRLRRTNHGRCSSYDGLRARFVAARCGTGSFFAVSTNDAYSYLLPAPLAPGRYVLDVRAGDAVGNQTVLARGSSRIVFYVR